MLIAISGSQGSGKSTVVSELKARGYNTIERKTSRSILSDWGVTLEQVNNDHDLTISFQEEIITRKYQDEMEGRDSSEYYFTERSYADLFTYAVVSLGKDNKYSNWLDSYYNRCRGSQHSYEEVFYLIGGMFPVVHDGVRGSNTHYSRMVDVSMMHFSEMMSTEGNMHLIGIGELNERIKIIERTMLLPYTKK